MYGDWPKAAIHHSSTRRNGNSMYLHFLREEKDGRQSQETASGKQLS